MQLAPPTDFVEFFVNYEEYVRATARKMGLSDDEDTTQALMLKVWEKDLIGQYDPSRKVEFATFLSAALRLYARSERERQMAKGFTPLRSLRGVNVNVDTLDGLTNLLSSDAYEEVEFIESCRNIQDRLAERPVRGKRDLARIFRLIVLQVLESGKISRGVLARTLGVSETAVGDMIYDLRAALRDMGSDVAEVFAA